jgi:hypothetical protein
LRKVGIDGDVEQSALTYRVYRRKARQRLGKPTTGVDEAKSTRSFRHQHAPIGKKGESPGMLEAARDGLYRDVPVAWRGLRGGLCGPSPRRLRFALRHQRRCDEQERQRHRSAGHTGGSHLELLD